MDGIIAMMVEAWDEDEDEGRDREHAETILSRRGWADGREWVDGKGREVCRYGPGVLIPVQHYRNFSGIQATYVLGPARSNVDSVGRCTTL